MFNLGTLIIFGICGIAAGIMFGTWLTARDCDETIKEMRAYYIDSTKMLIDKLIEYKDTINKYERNNKND